MAAMKTRSADIQTAVQTEISIFMKSEDFKDLLKASLKEVIEEMVQQVVNPLTDKVTKLEEEITKLQEKCNDNEQYSRRSNIRIYGVEIPTVPSAEDTSDGRNESPVKEDCVKTVLDFCKDNLGIAIQRSEIDRAHRIGKSNAQGQRAIIVKFRSYESKRRVMKVKKKLKGKGLFVNEDLTWSNQQLYKRVREIVKDSGYVFTADGYILLRRRDDEPPVRIRRESDLGRYGFL